ncbi:DNA polymerase III subunit alpha [bacterium]|nr:DNA polymerase III subunit alpha [bacterium]
MKHAEFVHLHLHTQYSLLDGAIRLNDLFKKAHHYKIPALAITDHGNMFGAVEFYQEAYKSGIKPIIGCEVYVAPGSRWEKDARSIKDTSHHLILLAKDHIGYKNLMMLVSKGYLEGFYYRPRIDKELLKTHNQGLIALSSCLHGEIATHITNHSNEKAFQAAVEYSSIFDDRRFYLELQENKIPEQRDVNKVLINMGRDLSLPLVATNDCHYLNKEDVKAHEILLCLQTGKKLNSPDRMKFSSDEFYFKSPQEMVELFSYAPDAIKNTVEIAERCNLKIEFDKIHFPKYQAPDHIDLNDYLETLAREGLQERLEQYQKKHAYSESAAIYEKRLEDELAIIRSTGFTNYFLTVADFVNYAKQRNIPVGPGRGSAAGSLVAYALKITEVDPIIYRLLFERFLNPDRISLPDIDIDFCMERRDEMIDYVSTKYGKENVAQIITFGKMQAKGVIRDVGRVLDMPYKEVDHIAKLIPNTLNITLSDALKQEPQLEQMMKDDEQISELFSLSLSLEGLPRHASTHAAGIVISDMPLVEYLPLYRGQNNEVVTQFEMKAVSKIGLIKFDFLGLRTLTVIHNCLNLINHNQEEPLHINDLPLDDEQTFKLLSTGEADGIFQLESQGMKDLLVRLKPESIDDLIALLALYRPGPLGSGMVDDFIKRKRGDVPIRYVVPQLEDILSDTHGVILYQEQVMQIASKLANFSMGDADLLRSAMSKKKIGVMEKQKEKFIEGAKKNKINLKKAETIYNQMAKFAEYGFNKSHSTAYALIAFQTAYLKAHHPVEFMAALLTCEMDNNDKVLRHINECREMGIDILPPDINESNRHFTVSKGKIRFGLAAVKNVGTAAIESIISNRNESGKFASLYDFCKRIDLRKANRRVIESLIKCGAFDSTGAHRSQIMAVLDTALEIAQRFQKDRMSKQINMFDLFEKDGTDGGDESFPNLPEWSDEELLSYEKESIGFYITQHPLNRFKDYLSQYTNTDTIAILKQTSDREIGIGGIVSKRKEINTRKGDRMCFITLEDLKGVVEVVVFSDLYTTCSDLLKSDQPILVKGTVGRDEDKETVKILATNIVPLSDADKLLPPVTHLTLNLSEINKHQLQQLKGILLNHPGDCQTFLHLVIPQQSETVISLGNGFRVNPSPKLMNEIRSLFGNADIRA